MKVTVKRIMYYTATQALSRRTVPDETDISDMLRYDNAFACNEIPGVIAFPQFKRSNGDHWGGAPTFERWKSFCIYLTLLTTPQVNTNLEEQEWYTYNAGGQKVTYAEYIKKAERGY